MQKGRTTQPIRFHEADGSRRAFTLSGPIRTWLVLVSMLFVLLPATVWATGGGYTAAGGYDQNETTGQTNFLDQSVYLAFDQQVTHAFSYKADFRYSRAWREETATNEVWSPSLLLNLTNDLFHMSFSGLARETNPEDAAKTRDLQWQGVWSSNWRKGRVPQIYFNYGQRFEEDDLVPTARDSVTDNGTARVDWDLSKVKMGYNYSRFNREDRVGLLENSSDTHQAHVDYRDGFMENRLRVNLSQRFTRSDSEYYSGRSTVQDVDVASLSAESGLDATPATQTALVANPALIDSDFTTTAVTVNPGDDLNINLVPSYTPILTQVDKIYIYTDVDISTIYTGFDWQIYTNPDPTTNPTWTLHGSLAGTSPDITYDAVQRRIEIDLNNTLGGVTAAYVKLYTSATPLVAVNFTEVRTLCELVFTFATSSYEARSDTYRSDLGLSYTFNPKLVLDYNFYLETRDSSTGNDTDSTNHNGRLTWDYSRYFKSILRSSINRQDRENGEESSSNSYGLDILSSPLDTLDVNLGLDHIDSYNDGTRVSTNDSVSLSCIGRLYPDLSSSLDINYHQSKLERTGQESEVFDTALSLTSWLTPRLTGYLRTDYSKSSSTVDIESEGADLSMSWRLSELFSLSFGGQQRWTTDTADSKSLYARTVMAFSRKVQADLSYRLTDTIDTSQNAAMSLRWNISPHLGMLVDGGYQLSGSEQETWNIRLKLTANVGFN